MAPVGRSEDYPTRTAAAAHRAASNASLTLKADGSVGFVSETIDQAIWISAGTMNGGETVALP